MKQTSTVGDGIDRWLYRARLRAFDRGRQFFERIWYGRSYWIWVLLPAELMFRLAVWLRHLAYAHGVLRSEALPVPVIVVGNIVVGGAGKTPFIVWLVDLLRSHGYRPGVLSRGYGGAASFWPQQARPDSDPAVVGDEPVMLARRCACPVVVDPDRVRGGQALLAHTDCNILVCDDGLQHYRLTRDLEIALVDGVRRYGNGRLLPCGPLREPESRLATVDFVVAKGRGAAREFSMRFEDYEFVRVTDSTVRYEPTEFGGYQAHAIAGVADPRGFFSQLRSFGIEVIEHPFADHHRFRREDLRFDDDLPVLMTEKDAVKCGEFADELCWMLRYSIDVDAKLDGKILSALQAIELHHGQETA